MKKTNARKTDLPQRDLDSELPGKALLSGLQGFEQEARTACRGFQVSMAVNVFGVGSLLENNLPRR